MNKTNTKRERRRSPRRMADKDRIQWHAIADQAIHALARAGEVRDPFTAHHQKRIAHLGTQIANKMQLQSAHVKAVYLTGLLHDIGKIAIPLQLLIKPSQLTAHEFAVMKTHSQVGYDILKSIQYPWPIADTVLQHHERLDGSGYPHGLKDDAIRLEARIIAVADVVDSMISHRPYRAGLSIELALEELHRGSGSLYDPIVCDTCESILLDPAYKNL